MVLSNMFLTIHAATGVIIGQTINSYSLAFIFGFIFHFLLDMVPHGDQFLIKRERKERIKLVASIASIDAVIMGLFLVLIFNQDLGLHYLPVAFGVAGSILPDFFNGLAELANGRIKTLQKISAFHLNLHDFHLTEKFKPNLKTGLIMQLIIFAVLTSLIL